MEDTQLPPWPLPLPTLLPMELCAVLGLKSAIVGHHPPERMTMSPTQWIMRRRFCGNPIIRMKLQR